MNKYIVSVCRIPAIYNIPVSYVVESESKDDAVLLVKHHTMDLSGRGLFDYKVTDYTPPPAGKILSVGA